MPMFDLTGKSAVVTGAGSGIGLAISTLFSQAGAQVHVLDLTEAIAQKAVDGLNAKSPKKPCVAHACDVANETSVQSVFDAICTNGNRIDVLVCNAGISAVGTVTQATTEEMDSMHRRRESNSHVTKC